MGFCPSSACSSRTYNRTIWGQRRRFKKLRDYIHGLVVTWLVVTCGVEIDGNMDGRDMWTRGWMTMAGLTGFATLGPLPNDMLGRFTLDLDPVDRGRGTVRGLGPRRGYFLADWVRRGLLAKVALGLVGTPGLVTSITANSRLALLSFLEIRTYPWFRKMPGPHSPSHENEAMPENSSHGPTDTASHEIIGNFMTKMTELLEATLANRIGERTHNTSNDEALE
ncbi:hypothetical protein M9H77_21428 [Catharanthus roseus]|uniref:Uncharacterized protein n=1 Tax=Catharanthus roseus TaxID=4058 RepID=A0ACC0APC2_CATRO|nr:hypothetical protein M9H77_21428 [Catharanthus roseus]